MHKVLLSLCSNIRHNWHNINTIVHKICTAAESHEPASHAVQTPYRHTLWLQEGESGSCSVELVPLTTASGKGQLQVWLGSSQGWSLPVSLIHADPQVHLSLCTSVRTGIPTPPA